MSPRRSALLAVGLVLVALIAGIIATLATDHTSDVSALLGAGGTVGAQDVQAAPGAGPVPSFAPATAWDNSPPLTVAGLRGKVVLVDFWDASCINCRRTFPFLRRLQETYSARGLVIIGVHSPEFAFEMSHSYVARETKALGVTWPVAEDPHLAIWDEFGNQYWPADYLVDRQGDIRYTHIGEGDETQIEGAVRTLLAEGGSAGPTVVGTVPDSQQPPTGTEQITAETYLGSARDQSLKGVLALPEGTVRSAQYATLPAGGTMTLSYDARDVYAVLAPAAGTVRVAVTLAGKPVPAALRGPDLTLAGTQTVLTVNRNDLFHLLTGPRIAPGTLALTPLDGALEGYTFTFGA